MIGKEFINKKILKIELSSSKTFIKITTDKGLIFGEAEGDCCSVSWVENIEVPAMGLPCMVLDYEYLSFGEIDSEDEYSEYLQKYGIKITTDKGLIEIDYRNESNGNYGGYICWYEELPHYAEEEIFKFVES